MLNSRATVSIGALSGGNNLDTALSLNNCPYLATSFFLYRPSIQDSIEATTILTQGVLIPAVLLAPRRWLLLGLLSGLTSGVGGAVLVEVFHFMGREVVIARFPQLLEWGHWQIASEWLNDYGLLALAFIAGSPIPQTPAIFVYSLGEPSTLGVMLAVGIGKTVKYVFLAWLTVRYPARFIAYCQGNRVK